jgi:hypothetical protein
MRTRWVFQGNAEQFRREADLATHLEKRSVIVRQPSAKVA